MFEQRVRAVDCTLSRWYSRHVTHGARARRGAGGLRNLQIGLGIPAPHDVGIAGRGLAHPMAASAMTDPSVVWFEAAGDRVGGRISSKAPAPYWLKPGVDRFAGSETPLGALIEPCGLEARLVGERFAAVASEGRVARHGSPLALRICLRLSLRGWAGLARAAARIVNKSRAYQEFVTQKRGVTSAAVNRRLLICTPRLGRGALPGDSFDAEFGDLAPLTAGGAGLGDGPCFWAPRPVARLLAESA